MTTQRMRRQEPDGMDTSLSALTALLRETLTDPRSAARRILAFELPIQVRWLALVLVAVVSALLFHLSLPPMEMPEGEEISVPLVFRSPLFTAFIQAAVIAVTALVVHHVGARLGGRGRFEDGLLLVVWLQFILICLQVAQLAVGLLVPPLAEMLGIVALVLSLWLLTNFVAELHGFESLGKVFLGIMLTSFAMAVLLALVLTVLIGGLPAEG